MQEVTRELKYQLEKEDYMDWIHWNVGRQNLKKVKIITLIVYVVFLAIYIGGNVAAKREPITLLPTILLMTALGIFMFYTVSAKHQEQVIWKRSGLKRLEKTGNFPTVLLNLRDDGFTMEVPGEVCREYSYADIRELQELDRLFLLAATSDNTWQFVAKSAFESDAQRRDFKIFMEEKIEDAKEHPEKYRKQKESGASERESEGSAAGIAEAGSGSGFVSEDAEPIEPVDTSHMGKIGKMAHIMAAKAAATEDEPDGGEKGE